MIGKIAANQVFKRLDQMESGALTVVTPDGKKRSFGGKGQGHVATIEIRDWNVISNLIQRGDIGFAEDFRAGRWETDDLVALTCLGLDNRPVFDRMLSGSALSRSMSMLSYLTRMNTLKGSRKNIHAHYDLGNDFYKLWLDPTMTYSSAIYKSDDESLEIAQHNKYDRIVDQFDTMSGSILEVGCGWGGFAARASERGDFGIKGITLSDEQHAYATQRLGSNANIVLEDYRLQSGKYDHIVSIEMFEAVGERFWGTYFSKLSSLLKSNGKAVIQTITMNEHDFPRYRKSGDFIRSYIFPGGMLPSPTRFKEEAAKAGLTSAEGFFFGQDYAKTLEKWLETFDAKKAEILALGYDEQFIRLWRFYLAGCSAGFRSGRTDVMQIELTNA